MGKTARVVVCGRKGVGKTAILEQAIYGKLTKETFLQSTIEDIYVANVETERGVKEKVRFYDTGADFMSNVNLQHADGYVLVFDPTKMDSLDYIISAKKDIERNKERKEVVFTLLANQCTTNIDPVVMTKAQNWAAREKLKIHEVNAMERSTLYECFTQLASKLNPQEHLCEFSKSRRQVNSLPRIIPKAAEVLHGKMTSGENKITGIRPMAQRLIIQIQIGKDAQ